MIYLFILFNTMWFSRSIRPFFCAYPCQGHPAFDPTVAGVAPTPRDCLGDFQKEHPADTNTET